MSQIAINTRHAIYMILDAGMSEEDVKTALEAIKQPSAGYYYVSDVLKFINKEQRA